MIGTAQAGSLETLLPPHQAAVAEFMATATALPESHWESPVAPGQWSPAQVAEHVRLTYEALWRELKGEPGLRLRSPAWLRPWLRLRYLWAILRTGRFPPAARAPREVRPGEGPFDRSSVLEGIRDAAARVESELRARWHTRVRVTHHVFGRLSGPQTLRLLTAHTRHHRQQLPMRGHGATPASPRETSPQGGHSE